MVEDKLQQIGTPLQAKAVDDNLQQMMKEQHDLAKAVRSDDAAVLVHLWNDKIRLGVQFNTVWKYLA